MKFITSNVITSRNLWLSHNFSRICLSLRRSVCVSVQAITFEPLKLETTLLIFTFIFTISRPSLSTKVI